MRHEIFDENGNLIDKSIAKDSPDYEDEIRAVKIVVLIILLITMFIALRLVFVYEKNDVIFIGCGIYIIIASFIGTPIMYSLKFKTVKHNNDIVPDDMSFWEFRKKDLLDRDD